MTIDSEMSTKIKNASFIAACLVVLIHVPHTLISRDIGSAIEYMFAEGFCRCAVPFFFVVSGFFLAQHFDELGWYKREVVKRVRSILVPYFIWAVVFAAVFFISTWLARLCGLSNCRDFGFLSLVKVFGLSPMVDPLSVQLWYLRFLFTLVLVSPVFCFFLRCGKRFCFLVLLFFFIGNCFLPGMIPCSPLHVFFRHTFVFNGFFYFFVGMVISRYYTLETLFIKRTKVFCCFVGGTVLVVFNTLLFYFGIECRWLISPVSTVANFMLLVCLWSIASRQHKVFGFDVTWVSFPMYLFHYCVVHGVSKGFTLFTQSLRGGGGAYAVF